jgi:ribonuclease P protein component
VKEPWRPIVSAGVSVAKKKLKRAVDRNHFKRMVRESFRLNKHILTEHALKTNVKFMLVFIFTGDSLPPFADIQSKMIVTLQRIAIAHEESTQ